MFRKLLNKLILIIIISFLLIGTLPLINPYVSDRSNITFTPDIAGRLEIGLFGTRTDGSYLWVEDESGLFSPDHRGYVKYNISVLANNTYNYLRTEAVFNEIEIGNDLTGWNSADRLWITRLNLTYINSTDPLASPLSELIRTGLVNNVSAGYTTTSRGKPFNLSIDGVFVLTWSDIYNQKQGDGYLSLGYNIGDNVGSDERLTINGSDTRPPKLIVQTSCLPPFTFTTNNNWFVNKTCIIQDENFTIFGNLTILDAGNLILNGTSIATFNNNGSNICQRNGGKLQVYGGAKVYGKF